MTKKRRAYLVGYTEHYKEELVSIDDNTAQRIHQLKAEHPDMKEKVEWESD